ncbi:MAG TPA: alpha/beta hydrolase [Gammaproteobacteria bacterium]
MASDLNWMQLDPEAAALLDLMAGADRRPWSSFPPGMVRTVLDEGMKAVAARDIPIEKIEELEVTYGDRSLGFRIYTPLGVRELVLPGIVYLHGGAFVAGSLDTHDSLCRLLANESKARVVAVDYGLAPEHPFPRALEDAIAALRWLSEHGSIAGIDPRRIVVAGDSAGGNIAAAACLVIRDEGAKPVRLQILIYPITDLRADTASRRHLTQSYLAEAHALDYTIEMYLGDDVDWRDFRVSPLRAEHLGGLPSALIVTAGLDPLRDEALAYGRALSAAGVPVEYLRYEKMFHGFLNATGVLNASRDAIRDIATVLTRSLGHKQKK